MTKQEKKMRDFISAEITNRELNQEQLDKLAEVLYPHDGTNEGILHATRQFSIDIMGWVNQKEAKKQKDAPIVPMSENEIEALAAMM